MVDVDVRDLSIRHLCTGHPRLHMAISDHRQATDAADIADNAGTGTTDGRASSRGPRARGPSLPSAIPDS